MFYPEDSLRKGGRFYLCWLADSWPVCFATITQRQLCAQDIRKISDDLLQVMNNESGRPANRFSLRLSSQLIRGLVRVYQKKANMMLSELCMIAARVMKHSNKKFYINERAEEMERQMFPLLEMPAPVQEPVPEPEERVEEMIQQSGNAVTNIENITLKESAIPEFQLPPNDGFGEEDPNQALQLLQDRTLEEMLGAPSALSALGAPDLTAEPAAGPDRTRDASRLTVDATMERMSDHDISLFRKSTAQDLVPEESDKEIPIPEIPPPDLPAPTEKEPPVSEPELAPPPAPQEPELAPPPAPQEPELAPPPAPQEPELAPPPAPQEPELAPPPAPQEPELAPPPAPQEPELAPPPAPQEPELAPPPAPQEPELAPPPAPQEPELAPPPAPQEPELAPPPAPQEPEIVTLEALEEGEPQAKRRRKNKLIIDKNHQLTKKFLRARMENINVDLRCEEVSDDVVDLRVPADTLLRRPARAGVRSHCHVARALIRLFSRNLGVLATGPLAQREMEEQPVEPQEPQMAELQPIDEPTILNQSAMVPDLDFTAADVEKDIADMPTQKLATASQKRTSQENLNTSQAKSRRCGVISSRQTQSQNVDLLDPEIVEKENTPDNWQSLPPRQTNEQPPRAIPDIEIQRPSDPEHVLSSMLQEAGLADIQPAEQAAHPQEPTEEPRRSRASSETMLGSLDRTKVSLGDSDQTTDSKRFIRDHWGTEGTMLKILKMVKTELQPLNINSLMSFGPEVPGSGYSRIIAARCFTSILKLKQHGFIKVRKDPDTMEILDIYLGPKFDIA